MNPVQSKLREIPGMNCFFCSPADLNPHGLNLVFEPTESGAMTRVTIDQKFQSYPGMAHGGILSGLLDETMAYAGIFKCRGLPVTRRLEVSFRVKVPSREAIHCIADVLNQSEDSFEAEATLRNHKGLRLMSAKGSFAILSPSAAQRMMPGLHLDGLMRALHRV